MKPQELIIYDMTDGEGVRWTLNDEHDPGDECALYLSCSRNDTYGQLQLCYDTSDGELDFLWRWSVTDGNNVMNGSSVEFRIARREMLDCMDYSFGDADAALDEITRLTPDGYDKPEAE